MANVKLLKPTNMNIEYGVGTATGIQLGDTEINSLVDNRPFLRPQALLVLGTFENDGFNNISGRITEALIDTPDPGYFPNIWVTGLSFTVTKAEEFKMGNYHPIVEGIFSGDDQIIGSSGEDTLAGFAGDDTYFVNTSNDSVVEKPGAINGIDTIVSSDHYLIPDNIENIRLTGSRNLDCVGNESDNRITGNAGWNFLSGDLGADTFCFNLKPGPKNVDRITDFEAGVDTIELENGIFKGLAARTDLAPFAFKDIADGVVDRNDRILYNHDTGRVFYDADGRGGQAAVLFVVVESDPNDPNPHPLLSSADFSVI